MTASGLSGWQEQYMTATRGYPIATREAHIVPLLKLPFTRAVVYRHPALLAFHGRVSALPDQDLADLYWRDESHPRKRRASGDDPRPFDLTPDHITADSSAAAIKLREQDVVPFTEACNKIRQMFTRTYNAYELNRPFEAMRGFTLFTPQGGRGRSPELHIDNTVLSIHWSAALATFRVHDGELSDDIWNMLSMIERKKKPQEEQSADLARLIQVAKHCR